MSTAGKQYREHNRRLLYNEAERDKFFRELSKVISLSEVEKVKILLKILKETGLVATLAKYRENDGESLLHVAAKFNQSSEIIQDLIRICPQLLICERTTPNYYGQTALHIAIAKGNVKAVETMLSETLSLSQNTKMKLLHQKATGDKFPNTIMMGELPLSIAALTFNDEMMDILLKNGAEIAMQNNKGDTVFHSLINFAAIYPKHTISVLETLKFLHEKIHEQMKENNKDGLSLDLDQSDRTYIWFIQNNEDLNPLQLAAVRSQSTIFQYISNLQQVYWFLNNHDGLFDQKLLDITEIDTVALEKWIGTQRERMNRMSRHISPTKAEGVSKVKLKTASTSCAPFESCSRVNHKSVLEVMFDIKSEIAFEFIQQPIIRQVINIKWEYYRLYYYVWMVFHTLFMIALTVYSKFKADEYQTLNSNASSTTTVLLPPNATRHSFLEVFSYFYLITGLLYFVLQVFHFLYRVKSYNPTQLVNVLDNCLYRLILSIFSINLVLQFILSKAITSYQDYTLIIALIMGWWFCIFFLRAWKKFSFFTVMIQKVIFGDILRFSVIILFMLIAFSAGMYLTFKGSDTDVEDFHSYEGTMMLLFQLMLGLGDVGYLYQARQPWMAVTLFIAFIVLTYVLMLNALIAMMSQTCSLISQNRLIQWRVQQLAIIIYFEALLPPGMKKLAGIKKHVKRFDPKLKQVTEEARYFLDFSSIQTEYANAEDIYAMRHKFQTLQFGDYRPISIMPDYINTINQTLYQPSHMYMQRFQVSRISRTEEEIESHMQAKEVDNLPGQGHLSFRDFNTAQRSPKNSKIKREKSKRDKSPPKSPNVREPTSGRQTDRSADRVDTRKNKVKPGRTEPEGDINTSNDRSPDRLNEKRAHLTIPVLPATENAHTERRRHYSENSNLVDTHIGGVSAPEQTGPVHIPVQFVSNLAPTPGYNTNVDIGVISDSYT